MNDEKFYEWMKKNPDFLNLALKFAREARRGGREHYSIKTIIERIRWHTSVETHGDDFKICNSFSAPLARLLVSIDPTLDGLFEMRKRKPQISKAA